MRYSVNKQKTSAFLRRQLRSTIDAPCVQKNDSHPVFASWRRDKVAENNMISVAMLN